MNKHWLALKKYQIAWPPVKLQRTKEKLPNIGLYLSQNYPHSLKHSPCKMVDGKLVPMPRISLIEFQSFNQWINVENSIPFSSNCFFGILPQNLTWNLNTNVWNQQKSQGANQGNHVKFEGSLASCTVSTCCHRGPIIHSWRNTRTHKDDSYH